LDFLNGSLHHHDQQRPGEGGWIHTPAGIRRNADESGLTEQDYANLEARWITPEFAARAQLRRVDSATGAATVGRKSGNYAGMLIPYVQPGSERVREFRLRRDHPELEYDSAGNLKERNKYLSPPGRSNMLYIVPGTDPQVLQDPALPIVITEGEFKAIALCRAAEHRAPDTPRFLPIGLPGVYNWRGTIGKAAGPDGSRTDVKGPIPDLDWITWSGRKVVIAYDSDVVAKESVRLARSALAAHLRGRGAVIGFLEWDPKRGKGIDDHLADIGPDAFVDEFAHVDFAGSTWKKDLIRSQRVGNASAGRVLPILANAIAALRHAPEWSGVLAFNEFALGTTALKPAPWGTVSNGEWTDHEDRLTAEWLQREGVLVSVDIAAQAVQTVSRDHSFHPVRAYLDNLRWDGVERLDRWLSTYLGVEDSPYSRAVGSRWLLSAVARILQPGAKADCCLILEGPQGIRKSTALRSIAGEFFTDELADLGTKDAAMQTRGVWIIELSELDSLGHAEVARIKAFISRTTDRFRPPYGMRLVESPRQCVFAGTVNHCTYLRDETGGRRFWPVVCGSIDIQALQRERDQLWAEAKARFRSGASWWLETADLVRLAGDQQEARYEGDPWEEILARWLDGRESTSVAEVLQRCIDKPQSQWTQTDKIRVARCLRSQGWVRYRERQGSRLEWRYRKLE
jgi:predicted P-loop ATPase